MSGGCAHVIRKSLVWKLYADKRGKKLIEEIIVREEKNAWEGFIADV